MLNCGTTLPLPRRLKTDTGLQISIIPASAIVVGESRQCLVRQPFELLLCDSFLHALPLSAYFE